MTFHGMDPDQVLDEADALERAARRLEDVLGALDSSVRGVGWEGPDADTFRERWEGTRRRGEGVVVPDLGARARELQEHAEEQEQASSTDDGGWFEDVVDWLRDTGGDVVEGIDDAIDWVRDGIDDAIDWVRERLSDGADHLDTAIDAIGDLEWPRLSEVLVDGAASVIRGAGDVYEMLTGRDLHLADDGSGFADAPVALRPGERGLVPPSDLSQIIANTNSTYGDPETGEVSMSVVGNPPTGVIVNIPGTEHWWPTAGDNPLDLTGNAEQAGSGSWSAGAEATADAIAQLYAENGIPPGTPLMLNGHSQGGMIASSLAADEEFASQYALTHVMTYGSPVDNYDVPSGVDQLNIQHSGDAVPRIDLGGFALGPGGGGPEHATTITLDGPGAHPLDLGTEHSSAEYQESVQSSLQDPDSALSRHSQDPSLQPFLTEDAEAVRHYISRLHREH